MPRATPPSSACYSATPAAPVSSEGPGARRVAEKHRLGSPFKLCLQKWMPPPSFPLCRPGVGGPGDMRHLPHPASSCPSSHARPPGRPPGMCLHAGLPVLDSGGASPPQGALRTRLWTLMGLPEMETRPAHLFRDCR